MMTGKEITELVINLNEMRAEANLQLANDFMQAVTSIQKISDQLKAPESDSYAQAKELARYHLQSAARLCRQISEAIAAKESAKG